MMYKKREGSPGEIPKERSMFTGFIVIMTEKLLMLAEFLSFRNHKEKKWPLTV